MNSTIRNSHLLLLLCALLFGTLPASAHDSLPQTFYNPTFLLVANPSLKDYWFHESVVMVSRRDPSGPVGLIVNRSQEIPLEKVFPAYPAPKDAMLFAGGPIRPRLVSYLFRCDEAVPGALKVSEHIYIGSNMPLLAKLLSGAQTHGGLRVVTGFASWTPGQLENEIARGDWLILPFDEAAVFDLPVAGMWSELHHRAELLPQTSPELF